MALRGRGPARRKSRCVATGKVDYTETTVLSRANICRVLHGFSLTFLCDATYQSDINVPFEKEITQYTSIMTMHTGDAQC